MAHFLVMTIESHRKPLRRSGRACDAGIRFMVATGRNFPGAMEELKGTELTCDYVVSSGAEVRNPAAGGCKEYTDLY